MSTDTTVSPLRQRMIEDMRARKLGPHSQRSHIHSCRRFAAFLKRSPDTATAEDVRRFQLHLVEAGLGISNRNRIMTGVKFLFRPAKEEAPEPQSGVTPPAWPVQLWRSRTFSATMARLGVKSTAATSAWSN